VLSNCAIERRPKEMARTAGLENPVIFCTEKASKLGGFTGSGGPLGNYTFLILER
jgi:hypothetical protein